VARFALATHVYVCVNAEHVVLLDLREDRYWALEAAKTAGLGTLVLGWPIPPAADEGSAQEAQTAAVLELLRERRMLVENVPAGKAATPATSAAPASELVSEGDTVGTPAGDTAGKHRHVWAFLRFAAASIRAKLDLRLRPFEGVIERVRRRKAKQPPRSGAEDLERARALVEAFARYRIFLFSSRNECLYDSLALLEFLARHGVYPDWVFGVQTRPFAAHCWVQAGSILFNDTVDHVNGFTPIMVV